MPIPYELCIDLNRDRDYADANEDVTASVVEWEAQIGADEPFIDVARANTLRFTLRNEDERFSPEHASALAGFEPGALVRVRVTDPTSSTVYTLFKGWIDPDGIQVAPFERGPRIAEVRASGFFLRLLNRPVRIALQVDQRADQVINALLSRIVSYPPGLVAWLLGEPALSLLGTNTYLGSGITDYAVLEQGINTFSYVGDTWQRDTKAYKALADVVRAERGFLYETRDGKLAFFNRHHWHADMVNAVDATLSGADLHIERGLEYAYGNVVNRCIVKFHPRLLGESTEVLAQANTAPRVIAGATDSLRLMLDDGSGNRIGATALITPVANVDWTANSAEDGSGTDLTSFVSVSAVADANAIELTFVNSATTDAFIRSLQVRGTKLTDFGEVEVNHQDEASVAAYDEQTRTLDLTFLDDFTYAQALAVDEVQKHKDPTGEARSISFLGDKDPAMLTYALAGGIGARIALTETQTGADGEYHIIGERHGAGPDHIYRITQFLQPAPLATVWILGVANYGELGEVSYLAL